MAGRWWGLSPPGFMYSEGTFLGGVRFLRLGGGVSVTVLAHSALRYYYSQVNILELGWGSSGF